MNVNILKYPTDLIVQELMLIITIAIFIRALIILIYCIGFVLILVTSFVYTDFYPFMISKINKLYCYKELIKEREATQIMTTFISMLDATEYSKFTVPGTCINCGIFLYLP